MPFTQRDQPVETLATNLPISRSQKAFAYGQHTAFDRIVAVAGMIIRQGGLVAIAGVIVGPGLAYAGSQLIASLLYGVSARHPAVFAATTVLLLTVALVACRLPARRGARLSPLEALRTE